MVFYQNKSNLLTIFKVSKDVKQKTDFLTIGYTC